MNFQLLVGENKLSKNEDITEYIIYNNEASKEAKFQELKAEYGSVFTFHGSSIDNCYSILRNGPRNLSNTKMIATRASCGEGAYLAKAFDTSCGYSSNRAQYLNSTGISSVANWKHSIIKDKFIVRVLEIIKKSDYNKKWRL